MKKITQKLRYIFILGTLFIPSIAGAWIPGDAIVPACARVSSQKICGFNDMLEAIQILLGVFIWLAVPIATLVFAWIGWTFVVEGDKSSARSEAKRKLMALAKGMFFILGAWLLVNLIVKGLINPDFEKQLPL